MCFAGEIIGFQIRFWAIVFTASDRNIDTVAINYVLNVTPLFSKLFESLSFICDIFEFFV